MKTAFPQYHLIFPHCFFVCLTVFSLLISHVFCIVLWKLFEGRDKFFVTKFFPWKIFQPWMVLYLLSTSPSQSSNRSSLEKFIDKICDFDGPAFRNLFFLDDNLFGKNLLSNLFSGATLVRSFAHHEFIQDNSQSVVINLKAMILSGHYFWRHIPRRTRSVIGILLLKLFCNPKIC